MQATTTAGAPATGEDATRNVFAGHRDLPFRVYVATVVALGVAVLGRAVLQLDLEVTLTAGAAFWLVLLLLVGGEVRPLFTAGSRDVNGIAVSPAFLFALLLAFGLPVALVAQAVAVGLADAARRRALWRSAFNVTQYALAWTAAGTVLSLLGHVPVLAGPDAAALQGRDLLAALAAAVAYFVANQLLVVVALSLKTGERLWDLLRPDLPHEVLTNGALLTLAPLVVLAMDAGVAFVPLLLPPLLAVYTVASIALDRERRALTDVLTGLANRDRLVQETAEALSAPDVELALLLLDLDRFKEVNDTLGHHVGDRLLQAVAGRLAGAVRPDDTVARLGGDEFAVLLPDCGPDEAVETARRLREVLARPILLEGVLVDVVASIGVACCPHDGADLDQLLQRADVAMYLAKGSGTQVERYDAGRDHNTTSRLALVGELRRALAEDELVLHYQPKVELADGRLTGVEALVRWQHPQRGLVPPDEFVPAAERSGLIGELTAWVVDEALAQLARWRDDGLSLRVAVNVSARDLADAQLVDVVQAALDRHAVPAAYLMLEVTEGSLLADPERTAAVLQRLGDLGVPLSLDDFGTGWSSLSHLRQLPVQEIKIDRTFVERIDVDSRDLAIVRSIVDLAAGLGMQVVAEGVETQEAWERLRALGCGAAQGWYLSRAEPAERLTPWLQERTSGAPLTHVVSRPTTGSRERDVIDLSPR